MDRDEINTLYRGLSNCYDERINDYDIKPVNEPRRLVDDLIAVGCKVKRGKYYHSKRCVNIMKES
jgi:hypothetical protein